jgi:hypothetical protein
MEEDFSFKNGYDTCKRLVPFYECWKDLNCQISWGQFKTILDSRGLVEILLKRRKYSIKANDEHTMTLKYHTLRAPSDKKEISKARRSKLHEKMLVKHISHTYKNSSGLKSQVTRKTHLKSCKPHPSRNREI